VITSTFVPRIRNRAVLSAALLALAALTVGATSASANSYQWGDNGSGACNTWQEYQNPSLAGAELGTYCMQSVTAWIQINGGASQQQAVSCMNNAPNGSPGLSYSLDGQAYVNAGPWYALALNTAQQEGNPSGASANEQSAWQTGDGGDASLSSETWLGSTVQGSNSSASYGSAGVGVTNWGGNGGWQAAIACTNGAGGKKGSDRGARASAPRPRDKTIDSVDKAKGKAFLAREYVVKKNVTRTDTRTCPAGMVRKGKLSYTIQELPANNKFSWKNRSLVDVKMTAKGKNAGSVTMTLTRAKNPTVVQFQMRCVKG
jgi:hypothetical protein